MEADLTVLTDGSSLLTEKTFQTTVSTGSCRAFGLPIQPLLTFLPRAEKTKGPLGVIRSKRKEVMI